MTYAKVNTCFCGTNATLPKGEPLPAVMAALSILQLAMALHRHDVRKPVRPTSGGTHRRRPRVDRLFDHLAPRDNPAALDDIRAATGRD